MVVCATWVENLLHIDDILIAIECFSACNDALFFSLFVEAPPVGKTLKYGNWLAICLCKDEVSDYSKLVVLLQLIWQK